MLITNNIIVVNKMDYTISGPMRCFPEMDHSIGSEMNEILTDWNLKIG